MEKIFKHKNPNGTFTYTDESGNVIIMHSKRDFEYGCFPAYLGRAFGKYSSCEKAIKFAEKMAADDIRYCKECIAYKQGSGKKPRPYYDSIENDSIDRFQKHIDSIEKKLADTHIIKIDTI